MSQPTLTSFFDAPVAPVYNCWNCTLKKDVTMVNGQQLVKCRARGLIVFPAACSSWTDSKDAERMQAFAPPEGFTPKKYGGRV